MIEVTQRDHHGHIKSYGFFTEEEFGAYYGNGIEGVFGNSDIECTKERVYLPSFDTYIQERVYVKVAYNEKGKLLPLDHLIGIARKYRHKCQSDWRKRFYKKYSCGKKKGAYGGFRHIRTFQERRWAHAWDDEEFAPKCGFGRGRRSAHNLPEPWDDYYATAQKSWKWQSKHSHQWKNK